jgi:hypothetical protein
MFEIELGDAPFSFKKAPIATPEIFWYQLISAQSQICSRKSNESFESTLNCFVCLPTLAPLVEILQKGFAWKTLTGERTRKNRMKNRV